MEPPFPAAASGKLPPLRIVPRAPPDYATVLKIQNTKRIKNIKRLEDSTHLRFVGLAYLHLPPLGEHWTTAEIFAQILNFEYFALLSFLFGLARNSHTGDV